MDKRKISAVCATVAALAALCVPGSAAFAADGTLALNAGDGSTLAGHSFTVYKLANYTDVVKDGANVKSVSAKHPDQATGDWIAAALKTNGVNYSVDAGQNAAEQLLRLKTDTDTLRKVAGTLQSTAASSKVAAVKTNQTSVTGSLNLTLPEGYYLVVDAQGIPILVSTTIGGATRMSNGQTLGSTQIKTNVTKIDKKIKSVNGTWKDSAAATNGETRDFKATFTVPNKLAVDTITLEDHMTGIVYVDGSFHATTSSGTDITNQFGTIGKDKITAAAGKTQTDGTGFKTTSLQSLVDTYQGKQVGESYHLGFDLASVRNAEVPAANNGRVVFTGELGIYGNLVVIDHGLGLMSLYSHLSEIHVKVGDVVQKGAIIAKTGSTGLAFGDHLHFGILVGGVEVTPLEWLDPKWIKDNITGRLNAQ